MENADSVSVDMVPANTQKVYILQKESRRIENISFGSKISWATVSLFREALVIPLWSHGFLHLSNICAHTGMFVMLPKSIDLPEDRYHLPKRLQFNLWNLGVFESEVVEVLSALFRVGLNLPFIQGHF